MLLFSITPLWAVNTSRFAVGIDLVDVLNLADYHKSTDLPRLHYEDGIVFHSVVKIGKLRLEPEIGIGNATVNKDRADLPYVDRKMKKIHLGIGVFPLRKVNQNSELYLGVRAGFYKQRFRQVHYFDDVTIESIISRTDIFAGPSLGSEYHISDDFSLGCEFWLRYLFPGEINFDKGGEWEAGAFDQEEETIEGRVLLFLRWYF